MKKKLLVGAATWLLFLSCGEDRNDENSHQNSISQKIIGAWTIVKKESNGTNVSATIPCQNLGNFVFVSDRKLVENHRSVVNNNCITDSDNYTYSVDEDNKKITAKNAQNDILIYDISALSDNELVLVNTEANDITKYTFNK